MKRLEEIDYCNKMNVILLYTISIQGLDTLEFNCDIYPSINSIKVSNYNDIYPQCLYL